MSKLDVFQGRASSAGVVDRGISQVDAKQTMAS
jgi:hypothetical protein